MIDLPAVRALAERAKADDMDGLTAREELIPVALELVAALEALKPEWAVSVTSQLNGRTEIVAKPSESAARRDLWDAKDRSDQSARLMRREVGPWVEVADA